MSRPWAVRAARILDLARSKTNIQYSLSGNNSPPPPSSSTKTKTTSRHPPDQPIPSTKPGPMNDEPAHQLILESVWKSASLKTRLEKQLMIHLDEPVIELGIHVSLTANWQCDNGSSVQQHRNVPSTCFTVSITCPLMVRQPPTLAKVCSHRAWQHN